MDDFKLDLGDEDQVEVSLSANGVVLLSVDDYLDGTQVALSTSQARQLAGVLLHAADEGDCPVSHTSLWELADGLADDLYNKGYRDARKENDKDARACDEWQKVVDAIRRDGDFGGLPG